MSSVALRTTVVAGAALRVIGDTRRHPRHLVLFAVVAGLLVAPRAPQLVLPLAAVAGLLAGRLPLALAAVVAVLAAALLAEARADALGPGPLAAAIGSPMAAEAVLLEPVRVRANGSVAVRGRIVGAATPDREGAALADRMRGEQAVIRSLDGSTPPGAEVGTVVRLDGRVAPLGAADQFQRRRGAHVAVIVDRWSLTGRRRGGVWGALDAVRSRASRALGTGLGPAEAALARGMVLGQDEEIPAATRTAFERSGLAHLIAVSGQNVLLLCTLVLAVAAMTGMPLRLRLAAAMLAVALYVPLAGGGPSIQRAGVMGIAGLVAALAGRPASRWYALGLAAVATLVANPAAAEEPGWQLSFAAVVGLLALAPGMRDVGVRRGLPRPLAEALAVTAAATVATGPLLAFHFEELSIVSLAANLVVAPAVAPVMWLGMLGMAAGQLGPALAAPLNVVNAPLLAYVEWVADVAGAPSHAAIPVRLGGPWALVAAYAALAVGIAALVRICRRHAGARAGAGSLADRRRRVTAVVAVAAAAVAVALGTIAAGGLGSSGPAPPAPGELVVSFLSIGQGDATLLQLDGAAALVDTGPPGGPILRRLEEAGVERLDLLVLTHAEADHEGMALPVVRRFRPRLVLNGGAGWPTRVQAALGPALRTVGGRELPARAGQALRLGRLRMRVLWPPAPPPGWRPEGSANGRAVVALVAVGDFDLLLPADAESDVTRRLALPRVEALKVAHHGSEDTGLPDLLARLQPQFAAIEVGSHNTYGHPVPSTLAALRDVPEVVRTDRDGTVRLRVTRGGMRMETT